MIKGSHLLAKLELVGKWNEEEAVFRVTEEKEADTLSGIKKIHTVLNHKQKKQMYRAYENAGKMNKEVRRMIDAVVDRCEVCKKNSKSKSKPSVAIPKATDFNAIVSIDLKSIGDKYILWMVCAFTKFVKGAVLSNKRPETIMKALHGTWCMEVGFPTVGFWCANGGEFRNAKLEEFVNKLGLKIEFTPAYSPWLNGANERNHYSCDVIVRKIMEEDKKIVLQEAVTMSAWTHNTNVNVLGYSPLQLMTGKSIVLPGLTTGDAATDSLYDDETVRKIMERHYDLMRKFREAEFSGS